MTNIHESFRSGWNQIRPRHSLWRVKSLQWTPIQLVFITSKEWIRTPAWQQPKRFFFLLHFERKLRDSTANGTSSLPDGIRTVPSVRTPSTPWTTADRSTSPFRTVPLAIVGVNHDIMSKGYLDCGASLSTRTISSTQGKVERIGSHWTPNYQRLVSAKTNPPKVHTTPNWLTTQLLSKLNHLIGT